VVAKETIMSLKPLNMTTWLFIESLPALNIVLAITEKNN
jgi:hypothetical protein